MKDRGNADRQFKDMIDGKTSALAIEGYGMTLMNPNAKPAI